MNELLLFLLGLVIGTLAGITMLCIIQINKMSCNSQEIKVKAKNEKKNN